MLNLTISHYVYLTRDQRYSLHEGSEIYVTGTSVPVWYVNKITSEPAKEVFCKYHLINNHKDVPVQILEDGYLIHLPMRPAKNNRPELTEEEWRTLSKENPARLQMYYQGKTCEVSSKCLLDVKDGGSKYLHYREHNKTKNEGEVINMMHYIIIQDMEDLENELRANRGEIC